MPNNSENDRVERFDCECGDYDHCFRVSVYEFDQIEFILESRLPNYKKWYQRIGTAIKYIFHTDETAYDTVLLSSEDVNRLGRLVHHYRKLYYEMQEASKKEAS